MLSCDSSCFDTQNIAVITLNFEQISLAVGKKPLNHTDKMAKSTDPDQTVPDLGLHYLHGHICSKIQANQWFKSMSVMPVKIKCIEIGQIEVEKCCSD